MTTDALNDILAEMTETANRGVWTLATTTDPLDRIGEVIERLTRLQDRITREFPHPDDEVTFWETLWLNSDRIRDQWNRIEKLAAHRGRDTVDVLQDTLDEQRKTLYQWTRRYIGDHAPRVPTPEHFELGIESTRPDYRERHERIEGLYESIKRIGRLPTVRHDVGLPDECVNFAIIYGGGWNVSTFSILREADKVPGMNAFVAFDHPGRGLYARHGQHTLRQADAALMRTGDNDDYLLCTFERPAVLHFVCPHEWTGPPPHVLGIPVLRSQQVLDVVDNKINTSRAIRHYAEQHGVDLPVIREWVLPRPAIPVDGESISNQVRAGVAQLFDQGTGEIVVKPSFGEQQRNVRFFTLPEQRGPAAHHALHLAVEWGAVVQERIHPGPIDFDWRVLVARTPEGQPKVVGRFARRGRGDAMTMVADRDMLTQIGIVGSEADTFLDRLDAVSLNAFRAVQGAAEAHDADSPHRPLGDGSYAVPYFLGIDLIGDAYVMEINGNEVAGMWTDDRLYPDTCGRSNRTVLESARAAAEAYREALNAEG